MARFYPIYARRSDGKIELVAKGKRKELNQPSDEQLDQRPNRDGVSDFYREVAHDEPKHVDWRRKLGGMLARELNWQGKTAGEGGYILVALPENYRLYEHVKKTEKDGRTEVKNKTHAGGGNDRQDAYLYGHPAGRRKRFRSPNDFFPHLLWLCTDETGDPDKCSCKLCSPEDLETVLPGAKIKPTPTPSQQTSQAQQMARTPGQQGKGMPPTMPQTSGVQTNTPTPLPMTKNPDQRVDLEYKSFMYRPGELVWFDRGQAWGLGAILRRWTPREPTAGDAKYFYVVQSLSHPNGYEQPLVKSSHASMRPWLAWSVPKYTSDGLNNLPQPPQYQTADWDGLLRGRYGRGDPQVDASIMAAQMIDSTYTPFDKIKMVQAEGGIVETHYSGLYLGAEKIWVGDPVRLGLGTGTDILVVHSVVERRQVSAMTSQVISQSCKVVGDIYRLNHDVHHDAQVPTQASTNNNPHRPQRLTEDLAYRNARSIQKRRMASYWKLIIAQRPVELEYIKGRWYEASLLLPILNKQQFDQAAERGDIQESTLWMNSRGDCQNSNRPDHLPKIPRDDIRVETRREAFGRSLPPNAQIENGIQPPDMPNTAPQSHKMDVDSAGGTAATAIEIDPRFETADNISAQQHQPQGGLDDFMNLDGMDDGNMPGFGQDYGSQGTGPGHFY